VVSAIICSAGMAGEDERSNGGSEDAAFPSQPLSVKLGESTSAVRSKSGSAAFATDADAGAVEDVRSHARGRHGIDAWRHAAYRPSSCWASRHGL